MQAQNWCAIVIMILGSCNFGFAQKITISGSIRDKATSESLIGASVYCADLNQGTITNKYGFYSLTFSKQPQSIVVSYVGYQSKVVELPLIGSALTLDLELESGNILQEVEISGSAEDNLQETTQMGTINLPISQIKSVPALMGEVDVFKVLQLLPGVQSGTEGSSGLYVRGGGADQNLILLDGVPVYNASHLFGFFSVFNADAINHVALIKGGFPARYGGRLSSIIDISMKEGNNKKNKVSGSVGLISSKITLEGPIKNDKTSFIVSARRTYIDLLARPLLKVATKSDETVGYYFYDLNAKLNHQINKNNRLFLSAYSGQDKAISHNNGGYNNEYESLSTQDEYTLKWGNVTTAFRWNSILTNRLFLNLTASYSRYRFDIKTHSTETFRDADTTLVKSYASNYRSGIRDLTMKADFDYLPSSRHTIKFGVQAIRHLFTPGVLAVASNVSFDTVAGSAAKSAVEYSAYLEDDMIIHRTLKVNFGLHASGFYVDQKQYSSLQPRIALRYLITPEIAWKASYVWMTQFIHLLTNSGIGLPTDLWVPATGKIKPQTSQQTSAGIVWNLENKYELSIEGYYKEMRNVIEYQDGANYLDVESDWQDKVATGLGQSYGIEFFAHRKIGKVNGWIGYTLSRATRKFPELNNGRWFPYRYDRRHDLELTASYSHKPEKDFSISWMFATGNAVTLPKATYEQPVEFTRWQITNPVMYYGGRNNFRMKPYHRLDVSYTVRKKKKWGERSWSFGAYNAYSRRNPFFIQYDYDFVSGKKKFIQYSLFPIIPSVSYGFKF
jgi:outer membrane receptor for ferrienterochelin and colicin